MAQHGNDETREKLLDTAEKLFAEKGYDSVSVREITHKADVHLSAINYHFKTKKDLYLSVFRERWLPRANNLRRPVEEFAANERANPEKIIRTIAGAWLDHRFTGEERFRHGQLILREFIQPTEALQMVISEHMMPLLEHGIQLLAEALGQDVPRERLTFMAFSVFAQIIYFSSHRRLVSQVTGREYDAAYMSDIVDFIAEFTLRGLGLEEKS